MALSERVVQCATSEVAWQFVHAVHAGDDGVEGYRADGSVAVAPFELGEDDKAGLREVRLLRQREVNSVIEQLLGWVAPKATWR